jgi:hypothetical protein
MNTPRYFLAKYVPDLARMEPRNVGVVLWSPHGVLARFAAEKPGRPGEVDGRSTAQFGVTNNEAYRQWVEFWRTEMEHHELSSQRGGKPVSRATPAFLDMLASWNKGNFLLVEGGYLLDPVQENELPAIIDDLYGKLVDSPAPEELRDPRLDEVCDQLISQTKINEDPHFKPRYEVQCRIAADLEEKFEFSYAYGNGTPHRLFQRVPLSRRSNKFMLRKTVDSTAWMFEKVVQNNIVSKDQVISLVYVPKDQMREPELDRGIQILNSVSRVINLSNEADATREFSGLPNLLQARP